MITAKACLSKISPCCNLRMWLSIFSWITTKPLSLGLFMRRSIMILDLATHTHSRSTTSCIVCVVSRINQMEGQESPDRIKPSTIWWPCCSHTCMQTHTHTHTLSHTLWYHVLGKTVFPPQGRVCGPVGRVWSCCGQTCCQRLPGHVPPHSP